MSFSMWFWRVLFPGAGLIVCVIVLWYSFTGDAAPAGLVERPAAHPTVATHRKSRASRVIAEGRVAARPGAEIVVSSERGGTVARMPAREKAKVKKGDLLVELGADDQRAALAEAEAHFAEADADYEFERRVYFRRVRASIDSADLLRELDVIRRDFVVAGARRKAANAVVDQARTALARTRILAPIDGTVTACSAQAGEIVAPAARLLTICDLDRTWIEAEVDEFDAPRIVEGAAVTVTAEGYETTSWAAKVAQVPDRVADRSVRPEDPGRPSDTRVLLVKIGLEVSTPLRLGQQVEVEIHTNP